MYARVFGLTICVFFWCVVRAKSHQRPSCSISRRCLAGEPKENNSHFENTYTVDGEEIKIEICYDKMVFSIICSGNTSFDNIALPGFYSSAAYFKVVKIFKCGPPKRSYLEALEMLYITLGVKMEIHRARGEITRGHLTHLNGYNLVFRNLNITDDALMDTSNVTSILFEDMNPPPFEFLPNTVKSLTILNSGPLKLQPRDFENLSKGLLLIVRQSHDNISVKSGAPLQKLTLTGTSVLLDAKLANTLKEVTLIGWGETEPLPWVSCNMLSFTVYGGRVTMLPDDWLGNCSQLRVMQLMNLRHLTTIKSNAFRDASALEILSLKRCGLHVLPEKLLFEAVNLRTLDMSNNYLDSLADAFFYRSLKLRTLNLSKNNFTNKILEAFQSVQSLEELNLDDNMNFGVDICAVLPTNGMDKLKVFSLRNTNVQEICYKWRKNSQALVNLNLSGNKITHLTYEDLVFHSNVTVNLSGNNVTHLQYHEEDFRMLDSKYCERGVDNTSPPAASRANSITFSATLQCDCNEAWTALALRNCSEHVKLTNLKCINGVALSKVPFEQLACPARKYCPPNCECKEVLRNQEPIRVIHVKCEHANLTKLPNLTREANVAWKLYLAYNNISNPLKHDLPANVLELDLRHNGITQIDVVVPLLNKSQSLYLSGNKLDCACGTDLLLAQLHGQQYLVNDFDNITCSDGAKLKITANCWLGITLISVGLTLMIVLLVLPIVSLAHPTSREWVKTILRGLGILPHPQESEERLYDVFVSFAHEDRQIVYIVLEWLEAGLKPYRTLVHYRDWAPGSWIPAQIEASVRLSQRTLVFMSQHFLRSAWATVEFREAYGASMRDGQTRLIVILLEEIENLPLDLPGNNFLQRYLAANTYVIWNDFWFWTKLRAALPSPRGEGSNPHENTTCWTKLYKTFLLLCGYTEPDLELVNQSPSMNSPMLEVPRCTPAVEAVAERMAESLCGAGPEAQAIVEAVMERMPLHNEIS